MQKCSKYLILLLIGLCPITVSAALNSDTIPPVFTTLPVDHTIRCNEDIELAFDLWFSNQANAIADNGLATVFPTQPKVSALNSLYASIDSMCTNNGDFQLGFFATDSCGNRSDSTYFASFNIEDGIAPNLRTAATDKTSYCHTGITDTLQAWISSYANAEAIDACSDTVIWSNYSWSDSQGNMGFGLFSDTMDITIDRTNCDWSIAVSFFFEDGCGNTNVTQANFSITGDNESPTFIFMPADTLMQCSEIVNDTLPLIIDGCDKELMPTIQVTNNRSIDSLSCGYYNYEIRRTFSATDICGNISDSTQIITITDTLSPEIIAETSIAVDCDADLTNLELFATALDDCSLTTLRYQDSILFTSNCQNQIDRKIYAEDVCGNLDSTTQIIQVQDFSGPKFIALPRDTLIFCNTTNIESIFESWLSNNAFASVVDNCNSFSIRGLDAKIYSDTNEIVSTIRPSLVMSDCQNILGAISTQQVSFVAYDICGNITQSEALFTIIDPDPPAVFSCPSDFELQLSNNECETDHSLSLPEFNDNCLTQQEGIWDISLNGQEVISTQQDGQIIALEIGTNNLLYSISDCGGNTTSCSQLILVKDTSPPMLTCPPDQEVYLMEDECRISYRVPDLLAYTDNCAGNQIFDQTLPSEDEFLKFEFNSFIDIYQAPDDIIIFDNVQLPKLLVDPKLTILYKMELDNGSTVSITEENGQALTTITSSVCVENAIEIPLTNSQIERWNSDGLIRFTIINNANSGNGTLPCDPTQISGFQGTDGVSYVRFKLEFAEATVTKELLEQNSSDTIRGPLNLSVGSYQFKYSSEDSSENEGVCLTVVNVLDTIAPAITCEDIIYTIDPLLQDFYPILLSNLNYETTDNCSVDSIYFFPRQILCSELQSNLRYSVFAKDDSDNLSECSANIQTVTQDLNPEFLSGLCFNDTLKLISNLPDNNGFVVEWTGPNNFNSNQLNPQISNITAVASGEYFLSATSPAGCLFTGSINIDVNEIDSPEIFTNETSICDGEMILLNTNSFTEIVEYFWYEGISPNGTLIDKTNGPSLAITPFTGTHFYYVEIKGNGCNSNPSNTLELMVSPPPIANIPNPFITLCEGDELTLMTDVFGNNFTYEWTGPNNYTSEGQFPEVISSIENFNQGTYTLVIKEGSCVSDTATAQVVVFQNPERPIIEGESIFCEGQTAVLSVPNIPNGTRFSWFNNGSFFQSVNSNSLLIPAITNNQNGDWTVIAEEGICSSDTSAAFQISVESNLNIGATNDGPHCEGDSVLLTSSFIPGASYSWEDPNGINFNGRIITTLAVEGLYTVTVTTPSNCEATTTTTLEVGSRPIITALSNTSLSCMSEDMPVTFVPTIFPPGNYQYSWTGPNNFSSNALQPIINNINENDNGTYILEVRDGNCKSLPVSTNVDITIIPDAAILSANTDPCEDDEVTILIENPVTGSQTEWIWSTPFGQITTAIPELTIPNFRVANNGTYSVIQEKNRCRSVRSDEIQIIIQTEPVLPLVEGVNTLCEGQQLVLSATPSDADSYTWLTPAGTVTTQSNELIINTVTATDIGSYSVFLKEGNCESETSFPIQVEINSLPPQVNFEESEISLCVSELEGYEICVETFNQEYNALNIIDLTTGLVLEQIFSECFELGFLIDSETKTYSLTVVSINANCASTPSDTLTINIFAPPSEGAQIIDSQVYLCNQDFTSISTGAIADQVDLLWTSANPEISIFDEMSKTASFSNLPEGANEIYLTSSIGSCGPFYSDTLIIIVQNEISAIDDSYMVESESIIELEPLLNDSYTDNISLGILEDPVQGSVEIENLKINYLPQGIFVGTEEFSYEICYEACPDICASAMIFLSIGDNTPCFVGNVITPNGDGYNDNLEVPCLDSGNYSQNSIVILNQWGDEIFSAAPYTNNWDGRYKGKKLPSGTYFYILSLGDGSKPLQGYLTLEL